MSTIQRPLLAVCVALLMATIGLVAIAPLPAQASGVINPLTDQQKLDQCRKVYLKRYSYTIDVSASAYSSMQAVAFNCDGVAPVLKSQAQVICSTVHGTAWKLVPRFQGWWIFKKFTGWGCSK